MLMWVKLRESYRYLSPQCFIYSAIDWTLIRYRSLHRFAAGDQERGRCNRPSVGYGVSTRREFGSDIEFCASAQGCDTARTSV